MLLIKQLHKWLALLVGLQLLLWLGTGLYFNLMDPVKASGNQYRQIPVTAKVDIQRLVEPLDVLSNAKQTVALQQISLLEQPYYLLTHQQGLYSHFKNEHSLVNAYTAKLVSIDETMAKALAQSSYNGSGKVISALKLSPPLDDLPTEMNDAWQINFDDAINTSVYIDAGSGRIIKHSNDDKRFADIFFMLHFMDYGSEGSFNNVQIIVFAIFTLFFTLTGFIWTIELGLNGQYKIGYDRKNRKILLLDQHQNPIGRFSVSTKSNLLDGLIAHDIILASRCGGGGTCGQCKVRVEQNIKTTGAERTHLTDEQLQQGLRLACQHNATEIEKLSLC